MQKGYIPEKKIGAAYPLGVMEGELQRETGNEKGYAVRPQGNSMPTITLEHNPGGKIGTSPADMSKRLREPITEPTLNNPDVNQHDQYVKPNAFEHSPGAFNR